MPDVSDNAIPKRVYRNRIGLWLYILNWHIKDLRDGLICGGALADGEREAALARLDELNGIKRDVLKKLTDEGHAKTGQTHWRGKMKYDTVRVARDFRFHMPRHRDFHNPEEKHGEEEI